RQFGIEPQVLASTDGLTVGVWVLGQKGAAVTAKRIAWLDQKSVPSDAPPIRERDFIGFYGTRELLQIGADIDYDARFHAYGARYTVKGGPDPNGPVHLSRIEIVFDKNHQSIITRAHGYTE